MSRVSELIDLIVQGKNSEATEVLNQELLNRSYDSINELKPQVANDYFASGKHIQEILRRANSYLFKFPPLLL